MAVSRRTRVARWGGVLLLGLAPVPWLGAGTASATPPGQDGDHKITICHRTNSVTNPYVVITVDHDAADGDLANDNGQGDHYLEHLGPVFDPDADYQPPFSGDEWGDIIPPIPGVHDGLNWNAAGIAIYENDCQVPSPSPSPSETTESATPTPSETTESATPTPTTSSGRPTTSQPTPTTTTPTPTDTETTGSASPSESTSRPPSSPEETQTESTGTATPPESSSPEATESESSGAAALPQTGSDVPVAGAVGISLLLIGVGILLLLGPGRLMPATYHRKH